MRRAVGWTAFTDARGVSKGMGFARFEFTREATAAIDALNNQRVVFVDHASTFGRAVASPPSACLLTCLRAFVLSPSACSPDGTEREVSPKLGVTMAAPSGSSRSG